MATSLADSPPALPPGEQAPPNGSNGPAPEPPAGSAPVAPPERACASCAAPMATGQDWCLECGAGAPGSLGTRSWRSAAAIAGLVTVLVLGAAAAAVAALTKGHAKPPVVIRTVAQVPAPTTPAPTTPGVGTTAPATPGTVPGAKLKLPLSTVKPPKIPLTQVTPKASETPTATPPAETKATTPTSSTPTGTTPTSGSGEKTNEESQQAAILLDTNAASTYNPYEYPASGFGDPSLAIDGDTSTAWTAAVNPATAPKMAQGLLINLKGKQKISALQLVTATPGIRVQVYGANVATAPTSITDPAWVRLSPPRTVKKRRLRMSLRDSSKAFQFVTVWISQAPASAVGTATAPGHVDLNEVELFPTR
ncbi:MAG TPA: hypothetical protein VK721_04875 [Solirubrobacteraceae bacterium]|nr:hypothetical protein [Solirubrobacteraceae bacterium]